MAEGAPLLREYTFTRIEGSNPFLSAIFRLRMIDARYRLGIGQQNSLSATHREAAGEAGGL